MILQNLEEGESPFFFIRCAISANLKCKFQQSGSPPTLLNVSELVDGVMAPPERKNNTGPYITLNARICPITYPYYEYLNRSTHCTMQITIIQIQYTPYNSVIFDNLLQYSYIFYQYKYFSIILLLIIFLFCLFLSI